MGAKPNILRDLFGLEWSRSEFFDHYNGGGGGGGGGGRTVSLSEIGLLERFIATESVSGAIDRVFNKGELKLLGELRSKCDSGCYPDDMVSAEVETREFDEKYDVTGGYSPSRMKDGFFSIGRGALFNLGRCVGQMNCKTGKYTGNFSIHFYIRDSFEDPWDVFNLIPGSIDTGTPYKIIGDWVKNNSFSGG